MGVKKIDQIVQKQKVPLCRHTVQGEDNWEQCWLYSLTAA